MSSHPYRPSRRLLLSHLMAGTGVLAARTVLADELLRTPSLTEGPYYPDRLPLDQDNDLVTMGTSGKVADGEVTHLTGRVLSASGSPLKGATVEIWQCDAHQVYLNSRDSVPKASQRDQAFQGFGKFETASGGEYYFRTIKPVPYPGRPAPHIHFKVKQGGRELLTSQIFVRNHSGNARDGVYRGAGDLLSRELVTADFLPAKGSRVGELSAHFDIVLGQTPDERGFIPGRAPRG